MTIHETDPFDTPDNLEVLISPNSGDLHPRWDSRTVCPRCDRPILKGSFPALSRADNKSDICSDCGVDEAMFNLGFPDLELPGPGEWPLDNWSASGEQIIHEFHE